MSAMNSSTSVVGSAINLSTLPVNVPSLCIPRVFDNMTKKRVLDTIQELGLGEIDHIDMVPRTSEKGEKFQRVFIHFRRWSSTSDAIRARERLLTGKDIKIIYDDPWFWKVSANRCVGAGAGAGTSSGARSAVRPVTKPSIDFNDDNDKDVDAISKMKMRNERNNTSVVSNRSYYGPEQSPPVGGPRPPVSKYDRNNDRNNDRNRQQPQPPNKYKYERKQDPRVNHSPSTSSTEYNQKTSACKQASVFLQKVEQKIEQKVVQKVEQKAFVPTTPDSSPPPPTNNHRKTMNIDVDEPSIAPLVVDFGKPVMTAIKKRVPVATKKAVLVAVDDSTAATAANTTEI